MQSKAMMAILPAIILMAATAMAQKPTLRWDHFQPPDYPRLARAAHMENQVTLDFELRQDGKVAGNPQRTGHSIFAQAALKSLKQSRLTCLNCSEETHRFHVVYEFKMIFPEAGSSVRAVLDSADHITVSAALLEARKARSMKCLYLWRCSWRYSAAVPVIVY